MTIRAGMGRRGGKGGFRNKPRGPRSGPEPVGPLRVTDKVGSETLSNKWAISESGHETWEYSWLISLTNRSLFHGLSSEIGVSPFFQNGHRAFSYKLASEFMKYERKVKMKWPLLEDLGSASRDWTSHYGKRHSEVSLRSNLGSVSLCVIGISQF